MNKGADKATGDILWFLHADTIIPATASKSIIHNLSNTANVWGRFNISLSGSRPIFRLIESMINLRSCITGVATGDQGIFILRFAFDEVGGFDEIPLMEDVVISNKLKRIIRPICIKQRLTTSSRRWEKNGIFKTILLMWRLRIAYFFGVSPDSLASRYNS